MGEAVRFVAANLQVRLHNGIVIKQENLEVPTWYEYVSFIPMSPAIQVYGEVHRAITL